MNDPEIERILREAKEESDGRVIVFLVFLALLVVCGVAFYVAHGGWLT